MKYFKRILFVSFLSVILLQVSTLGVSALDMNEITAPSGALDSFLSLVPLIVVLVLLFLKVDMILAGFIAAVLAMLIGNVDLATLNGDLMTAIPQMLSNTVPILNSAIAMAVFSAGSYSASLELVKRGIKGKVEYVSAFIVILVAAATYMSGIGGGSAMVIAPLAFAAVGATPELIAAMSLAVAVSFTTSPASLETSMVAQLGNIDPSVYVTTMRPFWAGFVILAVLLAFFGAKKRKLTFKEDPDNRFASMSSKELAKFTVPAVFLLFSVIAGPVVNKAIGFGLFVPVVNMIGTLALIILCTDVTVDKTFKSLVDGSTYILKALFQVGIFLGFIYVIARTGAFSVIANLAQSAPTFLVVPTAILAGFAIGVPAGAYVGSILALVLPVGIALGFSPLAIGLVTMATGLGSQLCVVNITMQALSSGFKVDIIDVVKGNLKWILSAVGILILLSFIVL
ncbi:citrate transporter [Erysipelothrix urinaevulpis]|uniref:citrate transporter n=1 Tax=Erysipelothrix urinaevulpis TaxID=2683717 RepID=UPI00135C4226|nr:citrate transporter [Erysipelothrix urinaevulpis]